MTSSSSDFVPPSSSPQQEPNQKESSDRSGSQADSLLGTAKQQVNSLTGGASQAKDHVTGAAGEKMAGVKETVLDGAVPAAAGALQSAQGKIVSLTTGAGQEGQSSEKDAVAHASDGECIDRMDREKVCDFLRESHKSTKPPPSTK